MKKAWMKSWTTWVLPARGRGDVTGGYMPSKWSAVVSGIPGGVQSSGLSKACSDLLGTASSPGSEGGRERRLRGTLEPARPLLQKEGKDTTAGCSGRVGGGGGVQGYRGTMVRTLHLPVSPSTCQPANRPSYGATVRVCGIQNNYCTKVCSLCLKQCLTAALGLFNPFRLLRVKVL